MLAPAVAEKWVAKSARMSAKVGGHNVPWSGYMGAIAQDAFDRTTTGVVSTEQRVLSAEKNAYGAMAPGFTEDALMDSFGGLSFGAMAPAKEDRAPAFITKEEWNENHEFHRKGVEWRENMTFERARIYAEDYDEREFRKMLIQKGGEQYGFVTGTVPGFIAGTLGALPDPINLIPIGRAFGAGRGFWGGLRQGALEGALSNVAVDAVTLPDLKRRGEDVGFADLTMDVAFGAAVGGLFGGAGGWLGKRRDARGVNEFARTRIHGQARRDILIAQEAAVSDVVNGRRVDVGATLDAPEARRLGESFLETQERIDQFIDFALSDKAKGIDANLPYRNVTFFEAMRVFQESGLDIAGFRHELSISNIRHFMLEHGNEVVESARGQRAVTPDDIRRIVHVIENPDRIAYAGKNRKGPALRYEKRLSDGTFIYIEAVATKKRRLLPHTLYIKKGAPISDASPSGNPAHNVRNDGAYTRQLTPESGTVNRFAIEEPEEFSPAPPVSERTQSAYEAMGVPLEPDVIIRR